MKVLESTRTLVVTPCVALGALLAACAGGTPQVTPRPAPDSAAVADRTTAHKVARLELQVLERDVQIEELQTRLDEARQEVVRAMAKLQTMASRAEAASAMAEAEVTLQSLKLPGGQESPLELSQARHLLQMSTAEFDRQNYGGALYLANQAKGLVGLAQGQLSGGERASLRSGEVLFALPLRLQTLGRSNVRDGPGAGFKILFTLDPGTPVTGYSYADEWVRVSDESGRKGWILYSLVGRRRDADR